MADLIVIEDPTGARATVAFEAVKDHELRGFKAIGVAVAPGDPRTREELDRATAAEAAAVKALHRKITSKKEQ